MLTRWGGECQANVDNAEWVSKKCYIMLTYSGRSLTTIASGARHAKMQKAFAT